MAPEVSALPGILGFYAHIPAIAPPQRPLPQTRVLILLSVAKAPPHISLPPSPPALPFASPLMSVARSITFAGLLAALPIPPPQNQQPPSHAHRRNNPPSHENGTVVPQGSGHCPRPALRPRAWGQGQACLHLAPLPANYKPATANSWASSDSKANQPRALQFLSRTQHVPESGHFGRLPATESPVWGRGGSPGRKTQAP